MVNKEDLTLLRSESKHQNTNNEGFTIGEIGDLAQLIKNRNSEVKDKIIIVDTLLGISESMRQFSLNVISKFPTTKNKEWRDK
jgi:hypothetical protein